MAFLNRVGNLLKQKVTKHVTSQFSASNSSLFQAIRSMSSSSKVFVGGLSYSTDEMSLREAFSQYGEVVEARVILDRETGRSRGFGFVTYTSSEAASSAIQAFDGQDLHGRRIRVNYATEKPRGLGFGGGFGAGDGFNYGGQGGNYGRGGYQGGNYPVGDGSFGGGGGGGYGGGNQYPSGGGGYGSGNQYPSGGGGGGGGLGSGNQYPGGGGGFGGADNYPSGGGSGYGGGDSVQGDGNYGSGGSNYFSGSQTGLSSILNDEKTSESQDPLGNGPQGGIDAGNDDFGQDISDEESRDDDEQNDHVNTRS